MLLVAALRNPTVRLRYAAVRDVLKEYNQEEIYEELLRLLGCKDMSAEQAMIHLNGLTRTFDAASAIAKTLSSSAVTLRRMQEPLLLTAAAS